MAKGTHYTSLIDGRTILKSELGSVTRVSAKELPILNRLSIKRLVLARRRGMGLRWKLCGCSGNGSLECGLRRLRRLRPLSIQRLRSGRLTRG